MAVSPMVIWPLRPSARLGALNLCSLWWYNKHTTTRHVWCLGWKMLEDLRIFFWQNEWDMFVDMICVKMIFLKFWAFACRFGESTVSLLLPHFWWYQCRIRSFGAMSCQYPLSRHIFALNLPDHELHNCHNEAFFTSKHQNVFQEHWDQTKRYDLTVNLLGEYQCSQDESAQINAHQMSKQNNLIEIVQVYPPGN